MFLLFAVGAVFALCALLWRIAIYAVPVFIGLSIAFWALSLGAGFGAPLVGLVAGVASWELARHAFASGNSTIKTGVAILFALPAGYMCFEIVWQLTATAIPSSAWRSVIAVAGAIAAAATTVTRLTHTISD